MCIDIITEYINKNRLTWIHSSLRPKLRAFESKVGYNSTSRIRTSGIGLFTPFIRSSGPFPPVMIFSRTWLIAYIGIPLTNWWSSDEEELYLTCDQYTRQYHVRKKRNSYVNCKVGRWTWVEKLPQMARILPCSSVSAPENELPKSAT